jgi:internalin A
LAEDQCLPGNRAAALRQFFSEQAPEHQGTALLNTVKVLLVGNGRVGKTTLLRRLHDEQPDPREPSTHAIRFHSRKWPDFIPLEGGPAEELTLNFWDFGGQDLYHNTHRIFFQGASVFLIAWSPTRPPVPPAEQEENPHRPLGYWLDQVLSVNPQARIVLVRTRADVDPGPADWRGQVEPRHQGLPHVIAVDEFLGHGAAGEARFEAGLRHVREALLEVAAAQLGGPDKRRQPAGRVRLALDLVARQQANTERLQRGEQLDQKDTVWTRAEFLACAARHCRNRDGTPAADATNPAPLLEWLHAAGHLFQDERRLPDRVIVDQRWAVHGIYQILRRGSQGHAELRGAQGVFFPEDLAGWGWDAAGVSPADQALLLGFMESCGTVVKLAEAWRSSWGKDVYLCLAFLPKAPPKAAQGGDPTPAWTLSRPVESHVLGAEAAAGLLVALAGHTGNDGHYWRWGAEVPDLEAGGRVRIEWRPKDALGFGGRLTLELRGGAPERSTLLEWLLDTARDHLRRLGLELPGPFPRFQTERRHAAWRRGQPEVEVPGPPADRPPLEPPRRAPLSRVGISFAGGAGAAPAPSAGWDVAAAPRALREALRPLEPQGFSVDCYQDEDDSRLASVRAFIKRLLHGDVIVVFVSQRYLLSDYCMEELYQLARQLAGGSDSVEAWQAVDWTPARVLVFSLPDAVRKERTLAWRDHWRQHWGERSLAHRNWISKEFFDNEWDEATKALSDGPRPEYGPCHAWLYFINPRHRRNEVSDWLKDFSHGKEAPDLPTLRDARRLQRWAGEVAQRLAEKVREGQKCLPASEKVNRLVERIEEAMANSNSAEALVCLRELLQVSPKHASEWQQENWSGWSENLERAGQLLHGQGTGAGPRKS